MKRKIIPLKVVPTKNTVKGTHRSQRSLRKRIRQRIKKAITEWEDMDEGLQHFLR
ncbi:hypothetical protein ACR776_09300 [Sphingobacterium spiritivorum]|uniref:hypothetical protein n=1 Tax=Sphingobacterium spiritivorum TaxID=258 RepID=UPI003DA5CB04